MALRGILFLTLVTCLTACESLPGTNSANNAGASQKADRLEPRNLSPGECGLFVWTADNARRFVLFSQAQTQSAAWWDGTDEVILKLEEASGFSNYDQPPQQRFLLDDQREINLSLMEPQEIFSGTRYKSGSLRLTGPDGWEKVVPVLGLAACQLREG